MLPAVLRGLTIAQKAMRNEKYMGKVVFANQKALPAPAATAKAAKAPPSALKTAAKNTVMTSPALATAAFSGEDKPSGGKSSPAVDEVERITREGLAPKAPPTAKATVKAATNKTTRVSAAKVAEPPKADNNVQAISVKDMGAKDSVQMHGNVDGYGSQNDTPKVSDPSEGMTEEQLKKIGLETSNAEMAAAGRTGSISRFLEGNIDDANSVAYKKYGAGYGREVLRRKAASK